MVGSLFIQTLDVSVTIFLRENAGLFIVVLSWKKNIVFNYLSAVAMAEDWSTAASKSQERVRWGPPFPLFCPKNPFRPIGPENSCKHK